MHVLLLSFNADLVSAIFSSLLILLSNNFKKKFNLFFTAFACLKMHSRVSFRNFFPIGGKLEIFDSSLAFPFAKGFQHIFSTIVQRYFFLAVELISHFWGNFPFLVDLVFELLQFSRKTFALLKKLFIFNSSQRSEDRVIWHVRPLFIVKVSLQNGDGGLICRGGNNKSLNCFKLN